MKRANQPTHPSCVRQLPNRNGSVCRPFQFLTSTRSVPVSTTLLFPVQDLQPKSYNLAGCECWLVQRCPPIAVTLQPDLRSILRQVPLLALPSSADFSRTPCNVKSVSVHRSVGCDHLRRVFFPNSAPVSVRLSSRPKPDPAQPPTAALLPMCHSRGIPPPALATHHSLPSHTRLGK